MLTLTFLFNTIIEIYVMVLLLRIWMQWSRCDFYNPFSQFIVKVTQPVIGPVRRIIPALGPIDTASLLVAFILTTLKYPLLILVQSATLAVSPMNLLVGLLSLLKAVGTMVFWIIIIRSIMSWISQGRSPMEFVLIQMTEPLMAPIRRIIPALGGLDFSAMGVILVLYMLNYLGMELFPGLWYLL